jgi:pimeloyl-ACP methyl ester carboxylesterase
MPLDPSLPGPGQDAGNEPWRAGRNESQGKAPEVLERRLPLHGVSWRFLDGGEGEPLLFLHGGGAMGQTWCGAFPALAHHHRVILPDLPGFGATPIDPELGTLPEVMGRLQDFLEAIDLPAGVVLGNSLGGYLAAGLALREPGRFRAAVLLAPAGLVAPGGSGEAGAYPPPGTMNRTLFHRPSRASRCFPRVPPEEASRRARSARETTVRWLSGGLSPLPLEELRVPVLLLWGREDRILPVGMAMAVRARIPSARLRVLEDCGHVPTWEAAGPVAAEVEAFLGCPGGPDTGAPSSGSSRSTGSPVQAGAPPGP